MVPTRQRSSPTISSGRTGTRVQRLAGGVAQRRHHGSRRDDRRRLADTLGTVRCRRLGHLDQDGLDRRHVEGGRNQIVGEACVDDPAVTRLDLLHQSEADPLRSAALDLTCDGEWVHGPADVLRRPDPDDPGKAELDVDLGDDAHRGTGERNVRALARDLAGLRIERRRPGMSVHPLDVDLAAAALALLERRPARIAHGPRRHPCHPRRRRRACRAHRRGRVWHQGHRSRTELGARHLQDHACDALPHLRRSTVHIGASVLTQDHAGCTRIVEPLRVADVLEPDREPDAPPDTLASSGVARSPRQADRIARQLLGVRNGDRGGSADRLRDGARPLDHLARRQHVTGAESVQEAKLDRVDAELGRQQVHLGFGGETCLHGAESAHRPAGGVVGVHGRAPRSTRWRRDTGPPRRRRHSTSPPWSSTRRRRRRARSSCGR